MRLALLPATLFAACVVTGAAADPVRLTCPPGDNALVAQLCAALDEVLGQHDARPEDMPWTQLVLDAESPRPDILRARLTVESASGRHQGEEIVLSVTDRPSIPDERVRALARALLETALSQAARN